MKLLFVTRKYPPITGGMEKYSKDLYEALSAETKAELFANRRGNKFLPLFLIAAAAKLTLHGRRYEVIHLGDGVLGLLVPLARRFSSASVTITVHGLEVTYRNPFYRALVLPRLGKADRIIAISRNTARLCVEAGLPAEQIVTIANGVDPREASETEARAPGALEQRVAGSRVLCTVGRLVPRKGHAWFVREVMPLLGEEFVYLVAGEGPERGAIEEAMEEKSLGNRVILLGRIDDQAREWLFQRAEAFIMPNVPIPGDVEGFGLVLAEAASRGLWSIAARIDGIPDAVAEGRTGSLVAPLDAGAFVQAISSPRPERGEIEVEAKSFGWDRRAREYLSVMESASGADREGRRKKQKE